MRCVLTSLTAALLSSLALTGSALAQRAASEAELHAGPGNDFPAVARVSRDETLQVHGCVEGYEWCDVSWQDNRGWIPAEQLSYRFEDRDVRVSNYGPRLEVPVVGFAFSAYWDTFYSKQPWYGERDRWQNMWRDQPEYLRYGRAERANTRGGSLGGSAGSAEAVTRERSQRDSFGERAENQGRDAVERSAGAGVQSRSNAEAGRGDGARSGPDGGPASSGVNQPSGGGEISGSVQGAPVPTPGNAGSSTTTGSVNSPTPGNPVSGGATGGSAAGSTSGGISGGAGSAGGAGSSGGASGGGSGGGGGGGG